MKRSADCSASCARLSAPRASASSFPAAASIVSRRADRRPGSTARASAGVPRSLDPRPRGDAGGEKTRAGSSRKTCWFARGRGSVMSRRTRHPTAAVLPAPDGAQATSTEGCCRQSRCASSVASLMRGARRETLADVDVLVENGSPHPENRVPFRRHWGRNGHHDRARQFAIRSDDASRVRSVGVRRGEGALGDAWPGRRSSSAVERDRRLIQNEPHAETSSPMRRRELAGQAVPCQHVLTSPLSGIRVVIGQCPEQVQCKRGIPWYS